MSEQILLLEEEIEEIENINNQLSTYLTVEHILSEVEIEGIDLKEVKQKKQLYYKQLSEWWKKIDKKYSLIYSDKYKYDIDVMNGMLVKKYRG